MGFFNEDHGDAFARASDRPENPGIFLELWPSDSAGSGRIVGNNRRTGRAQGKGSFLRKAYCQNCGYPNDLNKVDHTGGSEDGAGAGGAVTKTTNTFTGSGGATFTEETGDQAARKNAGCAMCFSKNSSRERVEDVEAMNPIPPLGF